MKIYITGSERVSECHLKVHETNLNALFSYYHISLISVPVRNCTRMWTNCWHLALFTAEYSLSVNKSGMVTFPQWKASLLCGNHEKLNHVLWGKLMYLFKRAIILSFFLGFFLIIHRNLWLLEIQMKMPKHCHLNFKKPYEYICRHHNVRC